MAQPQIVNGMDSSPRGKLLSAAARLFREHGFERTTVRDIARETGIQSGSLFHHFASKEDILFAVMMEVIRFNTDRLRQAVASVDDAVEQLRRLIQAELQSIVGDTQEAMTVLVYEWRCLSPEKQRQALAARQVYERIWLDALEALSKRAVITTEPLIMRRLITGMTSWASNWFDPAGSLDLDDLSAEILQCVIGSSGGQVISDR